MIEITSYPPEHYLTKRASLLNDAERADGRSFEALRKIFLKGDVITGAEGSAYIEVGNTKLVCTVRGPLEVDKAIIDDAPADFDVKGLFEAKIVFAYHAKKKRLHRNQRHPETEEEINLSRALTQAFLSAIRMDQYPKSQINVHVNVLEDDGCVLSAAILCCSLALSDAGIEMYDIVIAGTCLKRDDICIFDPTLSEIEAGGMLICLALMPSLNQVPMSHIGGGGDPTVLNQVLKDLTSKTCLTYPVLKRAITENFRASSLHDTS